MDAEGRTDLAVPAVAGAEAALPKVFQVQQPVSLLHVAGSSAWSYSKAVGRTTTRKNENRVFGMSWSPCEVFGV